MTTRTLTSDERALAGSIFGGGIDYDAVRVHDRKYWPFQPRRVAMAPDGGLWFHPKGGLFCDDFCASPLHLQGLFIHEMTHVWQAQTRGKYWLPLMRHPFCRYDYEVVPGKPFAAYGIEQQAEIAKHTFLLRRGVAVEGKTREAVEAVFPFVSS